jgi:hypothetical protein
MGRVDVFFSSMKFDEYPSKNEIRSELLLGGVCLGIFIGVPRIYGTFVFIPSLLPVSVRLEQIFGFY